MRIKDYLSKVCRSEAVTHQPDVTLQQESNAKPPFLLPDPQQAAGDSRLAGRALSFPQKLSSLPSSSQGGNSSLFSVETKRATSPVPPVKTLICRNVQPPRRLIILDVDVSDELVRSVGVNKL